MRTLRKLILGETWALPLGIAATIALGAALHAAVGEASWWRGGGGVVVFALAGASLWAALRR
ncbi:MAG: hypothetical protein M3P44_07135 [Actinomycetota bacterium]|nr:hypothetical protein [Actinomycetota bacterium]